MSKAEERANEKYPTWENGIGDEFNTNSAYYGFIEGYHQAEKDLAMTIEDIQKIHTFLYAIKHNKQGTFTFTRLSDEQYQEALNQFNKLK